MGVNDWITIALTIGATLRIVRLVTTDTITAPIRDRLTGWAYTLATCGWCSSFWIAIGVAITGHYWGAHDIWRIAALALTASWAAGSLHNSGNPSRHEIAPVAPLGVYTYDPNSDSIEDEDV